MTGDERKRVPDMAGVCASGRRGEKQPTQHSQRVRSCQECAPQQQIGPGAAATAPYRLRYAATNSGVLFRRVSLHEAMDIRTVAAETKCERGVGAHGRVRIVQRMQEGGHCVAVANGGEGEGCPGTHVSRSISHEREEGPHIAMILRVDDRPVGLRSG